MSKFILGGFLLVIIFYLVVITYTFFFQRTLLYHPSENTYQNDQKNFDHQEVFIPTEDGLNLKAWFHKKNSSNNTTILYLHGNAGDLSNRIYKLNELSKLNVNFLLLAWRGFSGNEGSPTEQGLYIDAKSAVTWLSNRGIKESEIILYGESLGTGVAIETSRNKIFKGVILESPYTSMVDLGKIYYPYLPVRLLLRDKFETYKKISEVQSPILILHGKLDTIVPFYMGKKIYDLSNPPKYFYFVDNDDHMMRFDENLIQSIKDFVSSKI